MGRRQAAGGVLLEAMLALAVLGVGLLGLLGLEAAALRGRGGTWDRMGALALAMGTLEEAGLAEQGPGDCKAWSQSLGEGTRTVYRVTVIGQAGGGAEVRVAWDGPGTGPAPRVVTLALRPGG